MRTLSELDRVTTTDTDIDEAHLSPDQAELHLDALLQTFAKSRLIVTDRLHGMIFALVTRTPCLAFDNTNKKISSFAATWPVADSEIRILDPDSFGDARRAAEELLNRDSPAPLLDQYGKTLERVFKDWLSDLECR